MHVEQARVMAEYNQWMNERLYALCAELTDAERRADRGAFFRSIHGTLNHVLLADRVWLGRFTDEPFHVSGLDQELYRDFDALRAARQEMDTTILRWVDSLSDDLLAGELRYTSLVNPQPRRYVYWLAVAHFFNHQTHHRGQVTTLLSQLGRDCGVTDLIWLPRVVEQGTL